MPHKFSVWSGTTFSCSGFIEISPGVVFHSVFGFPDGLQPQRLHHPFHVVLQAQTLDGSPDPFPALPIRLVPIKRLLDEAVNLFIPQEVSHFIREVGMLAMLTADARQPP